MENLTSLDLNSLAGLGNPGHDASQVNGAGRTGGQQQVMTTIATTTSLRILVSGPTQRRRRSHGSTLTTVPTNGPLPVSSSQENFATHICDTFGTAISIANLAVLPASRRPMA